MNATLERFVKSICILEFKRIILSSRMLYRFGENSQYSPLAFKLPAEAADTKQKIEPPTARIHL